MSTELLRAGNVQLPARGVVVAVVDVSVIVAVVVVATVVVAVFVYVAVL